MRGPVTDSTGDTMTSAAPRALHIPSLDGLRCVAIVLVFLSHVQMAAGVPRFIPGNFGVTLFFFLSGYLITTLMRQEIEHTGSLSIRLFYVRRALRIFPTCYLVLAAAAAYGWYSGKMDTWYLIGQVFNLTNYQLIWAGWEAPIAPHTDVYWSLAVEEHFYLAFPALFVALSRGRSRGRVAAFLLAACGLILLWRCVLIFSMGVHYDRTYMGTDTRIDSILFGCVLALWGNPALDASKISESTWKRVLFPLSVLGILLTFLVRERVFRETLGYTLQGLCLFSIFITAVRYPSWGVMRWLNLAPVRWIGLLSYAIYLVHPSMLALSAATVGKSVLGLGLTAGALTVAVAALMYYGIERPMGRLRKRFNAPATTAEASTGGIKSLA
ncbi:MAG: acyltransferase [Rhizobacter sp.]|nr:acyltransferase [Rhizobacter sp.]